MDEVERHYEMTECPMCGQPVSELVLFVREQEAHQRLREERRAAGGSDLDFLWDDDVADGDDAA